MKYEEFVGQFPVDMSEFKKSFHSFLDPSYSPAMESAGFRVTMGRPDSLQKIQDIACQAPVIRLFVGTEENALAIQEGLNIIPLLHPYFQNEAYLEVLRVVKKKRSAKHGS